MEFSSPKHIDLFFSFLFWCGKFRVKKLIITPKPHTILSLFGFDSGFLGLACHGVFPPGKEKHIDLSFFSFFFFFFFWGGKDVENSSEETNHHPKTTPLFCHCLVRLWVFGFKLSWSYLTSKRERVITSLPFGRRYSKESNLTHGPLSRHSPRPTHASA